jgi:hypothetical protein
MRLQAELGDVDFITGDYLAEVNIAENAQAHAAGNHPGWEQTAWEGIEQTIDLLNEKRIKVVINGGAHNPKGLAEKVHELVSADREGGLIDLRRLATSVFYGANERILRRKRWTSTRPFRLLILVDGIPWRPLASSFTNPAIVLTYPHRSNPKATASK